MDEKWLFCSKILNEMNFIQKKEKIKYKDGQTYNKKTFYPINII